MRYRFFGGVIALEIIALVFLLAHGNATRGTAAAQRGCNRQLVQVLELTDLSIWTGARYTRHLSQADVFSAFQDSMGALERFPEGGLVAPAGLGGPDAHIRAPGGGADEPAL